MDKSKYVLKTFKWSGVEPTIEEIANKLEIPAEYIDKDYGIVPIDLEDNLYCILVDISALPNPENGSTFSNPRISPFDLEEE